MTCLLGNSEKRQVYDNFELQNLNSNKHDYTHITYQKYLETNYFVVPNEDSFWAHMMTNQLPQAPSGTADKGLFNCFPLCLTSDDLFKTPSSNIGEPSFFLTRLTSLQTPPSTPVLIPTPVFSGVISSSPLKIELEFSPQLAYTWYLCFTFMYINKIDFPGSRQKQECTVSQLK